MSASANVHCVPVTGRELTQACLRKVRDIEHAIPVASPIGFAVHGK